MLTKKEKLQVANMHKTWIKKGKKLTSYVCPHCLQANTTRQPNKTDVGTKGYWDSARICLHCGAYSFVAVYPSGKVKIVKL